jgi:predicted DNA-binding protein
MKDEIKYKLKKSKTVRLSDSAVQNISYMVNETKISESELLRSIIEKAIDDYKLKKAFRGIEYGQLSISGGAQVAGLSYRDFYDKMQENEIKVDFDEKSIGKGGYKLLELVENKEVSKKKKK